MDILDFDDWVAQQPACITADPLWRAQCFQLAAYAHAIAWDDCHRLSRNPITSLVAPQLFRALGSVPANYSEGYSRGGGRDRARLYEYSLGSARESVSWYRSAIPVLGVSRVEDRQERLQQIVRQLLVTIPRERKREHF